MTLDHLKKLSTNYLELLDDKDFNIIINVGEAPNTKIFRAHSNILKYRSLYFRDKLAKTTKDTNNIKTINLKNVSIQQFEIIIKYIYGGVILLENQDTTFIFELMFIASKLLLEELAKQIEIHLIETKANWLRLYFAKIHHISFQNDQYQKLQKWCNDFLVKYPKTIFESEDFTSLQENALVSLIKRDDLQMEEVKIWIYIIKWGIAQNSGLSSDPKTWTRENFQSLKNKLRNCLPHIRYFHISGDDIVDYIEPYRKILEKDLWKDILKRIANPNRQISSIILPPRIILTQILPSRTTEPFSTIINEEHAAEISMWIDKKTKPYSVTDNPYEFKLLLRGTRDGFTAQSFWKICDKQANTILVMKVKYTDEILGGYNPIQWDKSISNYVDCNDSFIFSLKNGTIHSYILSRVKKSKYAIYCDPRVGPVFDNDLCMRNNFNDLQCYCGQTSYDKVIRNTSGWFSISEYEIFQVQKK